MGYVGNQQTEGYSQVPAKQDLTGATGTSLTLTHAVASAEGIDLFINNVRQEPTTAYSVGGDGVTVTLTGSVVATDDIYVVYNSLARQTSTHPSNQALQATSGTFSGAVSGTTGTFSGAVSAASATVTGDLTVDTSTLYVDSTNNLVGIGETSPSSNLHVKGGAGANIAIQSTAGSHWRIGDAVGASNGEFVIRDHTNSTNRMTITTAGKVLINNATVLSDGRLSIAEPLSSGVGITIKNNVAQGAGQTFIRFLNNSGTVTGSIQHTGTTTVAYSTSSDYRLKENVTADWDATTRLKQLNPVRFNFIADADTTVDGFLAHEVQDIVPEAITGTKDAVDDEGNPVYQGIDQSKLVPLLVKTIQELEARIAALEAN